ncbi:MAG: AprI/Inh family metalloprotease inhibitor [Bradyrhizobiaceae bacterium]|nr:AprI/Inh family metalloprotease inhibitor [Bradyrhizobiaceae bacterium]
MRGSFAAAIGLALWLATPANAQSPAPAAKPDPADVRALAANYELTNADSSLKCQMILDPRPTGRGLALVFDRRQCASLFGFLGEVSAWSPGIAGAILFLAPDGRTVAEFTEGVGGVYEAIRENDGVYFLANLQFVDPSERVQTADLLGEWVLSRPEGEPPAAKNAKAPPKPCTIRLTDEVAGDQLFYLRVPPDCDAGLLPPGYRHWQLERGDIVLRTENGDALRFERDDDGRWNKVPEKPRPLVLSRP